MEKSYERRYKIATVVISVATFFIGAYTGSVTQANYLNNYADNNYKKYYDSYLNLRNNSQVFCKAFDDTITQFQASAPKGSSLYIYKCLKGIDDVTSTTVYGTK